MRYDIADQQCLAIIRSAQRTAVEHFNNQEEAGRNGFDTGIRGCRGESLVSGALREASNGFTLAVTSMKNFADSAAAGGTQAVVYYQTGDQHMADDAATAAFQATTPAELPGHHGGGRQALAD